MGKKLTEPTSFKKYSNSDYITSEDLKGRDIDVTIDHVEEDKVKNETDRKGTLKAILILREFKKPMVLNRSNYNTICKLYGEWDLSKWKDYKITLFELHNIQAFGSITSGIRVRAKIPEKKALPTLTKDSPAFQSYVDYMAKGGNIEEIKKIVTLTEEIEKELCLVKKK